MILIEAYNKFKKIGWFLPGFLLYAAFPPMCEVADVLFALVPLMWLSRQGDPRESAKRWFQSGLFFWVATLSWMPAIVKNGGPWPLVVLGWGALAAYCAAYFAAYGYLSAAYWRWAYGAARSPRPTMTSRPTLFVWRAVGILVVEPVLWAGLELVRSRLFGGFAWNQLGVVPANAGFGAPAAIGGVYLLSAVVVLISGTLAGVAERMIAGIRARMRKPYDASALSRWRSLETFIALALVWGVYAGTGMLRDAGREGTPGTEGSAGGTSLKVALVQRNFPCVFKAQEEDPYAVYSNLLANVSLLKPDLVVLPESAMCEFGPVNQQGAIRFARWVQAQTDGAALLAGGTRFGDGKIYNSAALYQPTQPLSRPATQPLLSVYDKVHLVPFGEFIPGDKWFPILQKLAPVGSCTPGEEVLLDLFSRDKNVASPLCAAEPTTSNQQPTAIPFGVAICFEDTDSALMRRHAAKGARFLCFITNDSWFSHSDEALAHAWQATARAIETGLPVVRVGNSGVTGTITPEGKACWLQGPAGRPLVDHSGAMLDRITIQQPTTSNQQPTTSNQLTFYVRFGDGPLFIAFLLLITSMILVKYTSTYGKHRSLSL